MDIEGCWGIKRTRTSRFGCKQSQPQVAMCKPRGCLSIPNTPRPKNMSFVNNQPRLLTQSHPLFFLNLITKIILIYYCFLIWNLFAQ